MNGDRLLELVKELAERMVICRAARDHFAAQGQGVNADTYLLWYNHPHALEKQEHELFLAYRTALHEVIYASPAFFPKGALFDAYA